MRVKRGGFFSDASGAVAPTFAIGLIALVAIGALAWDVSRAFALRAELDAAADAAALAGATQLNGAAGARTRATSAAQGTLVTNAQRLANTANSDAAQGATITFLTNLTTRDVASSDAAARFIQVDISPKQFTPVLARILNINSFTARARAVAGYSMALCKAPPIYVCSPNGTSFNPNNYIGHAVALQNPNNGTGNWGFIDVGDGASDVTEAMGSNAPGSECISLTPLPQPGNIQAADAWFNTRFDIYRGPASGLTSDSEYAPALNTMVGVRATSATDHCAIVPPAVRNTCPGTDAVYADGMGFPIDCSQTTGSGFGTGVWNARQYFLNNHAGGSAPSDPSLYVPEGGGWTAYGPAATGGASTPTRYQVYKWELAMLAGTIATPAWAFSNGQAGTSGDRDAARPTCNTSNPVQQSPDRRTITTAIAICPVNGRDPVNIIGFMDLFLVYPAAAQDIFAEVIGTSSEASSPGKDSLQHRVALYE